MGHAHCRSEINQLMISSPHHLELLLRGQGRQGDEGSLGVMEVGGSDVNGLWRGSWRCGPHSQDLFAVGRDGVHSGTIFHAICHVKMIYLLV